MRIYNKTEIIKFLQLPVHVKIIHTNNIKRPFNMQLKNASIIVNLTQNI